MFAKIKSIFVIPELRQKVLITLLFLAVYRIGYAIPLPFIDQSKMGASRASGALGNVLGFVSMFSGGNLSNATLFGLGIMPYISASIIFQLLAAVYPPLEKLQKEGESGRKKINEYTRYATVLICLFQAFMYVQYIMRSGAGTGAGWALEGYNSGYYWMTMVLTMTATTTVTNSTTSTTSFSKLMSEEAAPPKVNTDDLNWPPSKNSEKVAAGSRAMMPAMMMRLMPLPMPYSSICSPSHIRKTVPAVMVRTAARANTQVSFPGANTCRPPSLVRRMR